MRSSSWFVRLWFHMWRLFCHYLFLISPSFGVSGGLCFVIVAFPGYLHLYFSSLLYCLLSPKGSKFFPFTVYFCKRKGRQNNLTEGGKTDGKQNNLTELPPLKMYPFHLKSATMRDKWATARQNEQNGMCAQRRLRSVWVTTQCDQSLCLRSIGS